ncbi:MAG: hypothetical protein ABIO86_12010 [Sphingomonas sp.]
MKSFFKTIILVAAALLIMHIIQWILEEYAKIPRDYARDLVTYPGIVVTILVMNVLTKNGLL